MEGVRAPRDECGIDLALVAEQRARDVDVGHHRSPAERRRPLHPQLADHRDRVVDRLVLADGELVAHAFGERERVADVGTGPAEELAGGLPRFEVADASLELLMRRATGWEQPWFEVESFRVITDDDQPSTTTSRATTEATIKVHVGGERLLATAEGNGPVNALDSALRAAIGDRHPALAHVHLTDYKVRVLDTAKGTGAVTRVLVDSTNGDRTWTTIGVSENIIEASWQALFDSLVYGLLHATAGE